MNNTLKDIEPKLVFKYFEDLTEIPRCSGQEGKVVDYLIDFAKENNFEYHKDEINNLLIKVPATKGYENHPVLILQAHSDMVCEKNEDTDHDFCSNPIKIEIEDDKVIAKETTLGADDGIGVSLAMAIATDKNLSHPPLEIVITSDEERGLVGASKFDMSLLSGKRMINLDSDDEGVFVVGAAGGPVIKIELPINRIDRDEDEKLIEINIKGLLGGHSGEDIHRKRANSNKLLARVLNSLDKKLDYNLVDIKGGLLYNAIPREAKAIISISDDKIEDIKTIIKKCEEEFKIEYYSIENKLSLNVSEIKKEEYDKVLDKDSKQKIIDFIFLSYTGVLRMNPETNDIVESSISLGVIRLEDDKAVIQTMTRSSLESIYMYMYYQVDKLAKLLGGTTSMMSNSPEWEYEPKSKLKDIFEETYKDLFNKNPKFMVLHAGLEAGVFKKDLPYEIDAISTGPDVRNLHSPGEYVTISSTQKVWKFLKEVISKL